MSLAIGVTEGAVIEIDNHPLTVIKSDETKIEVEFLGQNYTLSEFESVELYPSVYVCMGKPAIHLLNVKEEAKAWDLLPRILFEAPRSVSIQRRRKQYGSNKPRPR